MANASHIGIPTKKDVITILEYIQSTGTQYINTGVYPSANLKTYIKFKVNTTYNAVLGSAWNDNGYFLNVWGDANNSMNWQSSGGSIAPSGYTARGITEVTVSRTEVVCNGITTTVTATGTNSATYPVYLFMVGSRENTGFAAQMNLYACKMYDDDVLIHDFVPCKNASGTVGLYDLVSGKFYANAGTGTFTAGAVVEEIGGETVEVAHNVKSIYVGVNGAARKVAKGYIGVGGIARLFYQSAIPLANIPEQAMIKINENGSGVNYWVVKHDYETGLNGAGRVHIARTASPESRAWNTYSSNRSSQDYNTSAISSYLNSTFLNRFDASTKALIGTTKFYIIDYSKLSNAQEVNKTCSKSIFLLSGGEYVTWLRNKHPSSGSYYWTRMATYMRGSYGTIQAVKSGATWNSARCDEVLPFLPSFTLPANAMVNPTPNADGSYSLIV